MLTLSQNIAQLEAEVEKITREKISAVHQLEEIQNQLASREMDVTEVQREIRKEKRREIFDSGRQLEDKPGEELPRKCILSFNIRACQIVPCH